MPGKPPAEYPYYCPVTAEFSWELSFDRSLLLALWYNDSIRNVFIDMLINNIWIPCWQGISKEMQVTKAKETST